MKFVKNDTEHNKGVFINLGYVVKIIPDKLGEYFLIRFIHQNIGSFQNFNIDTESSQQLWIFNREEDYNEAVSYIGVKLFENEEED